MFDIKNKEIREQKLKIIEILLVVGGIIGGLRFQNPNDPMNIFLGFFITGSLLYYFVISNPRTYSAGVSPSGSISIKIGTIITSFSFSLIAVLPFISRGILALYPSISGVIYGGLIVFLWLFISILTLKSLYD